jgi:hypothetical protein
MKKFIGKILWWFIAEYLGDYIKIEEDRLTSNGSGKGHYKFKGK